MAKKSATKRAKAKGKLSKPTKPSNTRGGGDDAEPVNEDVMDSAGEKKLSMSFDEFVKELGDAATANPVLARAERQCSMYRGMTGDRADSIFGIFVHHHETRARCGDFASTADVEAFGHDAFRAISKLKHLAKNADDCDTQNLAGRILADLVNIWLDRWPDDAARSVTEELRQIKEKVQGFQQRWGEINRRGRPRERGFAKKGEAERTENEELLSYYIWNINRTVLAATAAVTMQLIKGDRRTPTNADRRVRNWWRFVRYVASKLPSDDSTCVGDADNEASANVRAHLNELHHRRMITDEGWKSFCVNKFGTNLSVVRLWLDQAINENFDAYWSMVIEPEMEKKHYLSWAKTRPFQRESDIGKVVRGLKREGAPKGSTYPSFAEAKRKTKPILQEIMHPSLRPIFVWM